MEKLYGEDVVADHIEAACDATIQKAIEFEFPDLVAEAQEKMEKHLPKRANSFRLLSDMRFCAAMGEAQAYTKSCLEYAKKEVKNDEAALHELAQEMHGNFKDDPTVMREAEKIAKKAVDKNKDNLDFHLTYAAILNQNGKKDEARKMAMRSLQLAQENGGDLRSVQRLIKRIEG